MTPPAVRLKLRPFDPMSNALPTELLRSAMLCQSLQYTFKILTISSLNNA